MQVVTRRFLILFLLQIKGVFGMGISANWEICLDFLNVDELWNIFGDDAQVTGPEVAFSKNRTKCDQGGNNCLSQGSESQCVDLTRKRNRCEGNGKDCSPSFGKVDSKTRKKLLKNVKSICKKCSNTENLFPKEMSTILKFLLTYEEGSSSYGRGKVWNFFEESTQEVYNTSIADCYEKNPESVQLQLAVGVPYQLHVPEAP